MDSRLRSTQSGKRILVLGGAVSEHSEQKLSTGVPAISHFIHVLLKQLGNQIDLVFFDLEHGCKVGVLPQEDANQCDWVDHLFVGPALQETCEARGRDFDQQEHKNLALLIRIAALHYSVPLTFEVIIFCHYFLSEMNQFVNELGLSRFFESLVNNVCLTFKHYLVHRGQ